jgi:hypothetical protein
MNFLILVVTVALTCAIAYGISAAFWTAEPTRSNSFFSLAPFATGSGLVIGCLLSLFVAPLFLTDRSPLGYITLASCWLGFIAGFVPLFRRRF